MRRHALALAAGIGLALAPRARAASAFEAVLAGANEVPGPGLAEGGFTALVVVDGTKVTLTLTPKGVAGWMTAHVHRGRAGAAGRLVAQFPWTSGGAAPRTSVASISAEDAAALAAEPGKYYVDVHTEAFPGGAARGQLAARAAVPLLDEPPAAGAPAPDETPAAPAGAPPAESREAAGRHAADAESRIPKSPQRIVGNVPRSKTYLDPDFELDVRATSGLEVVLFATGECTVDGSVVHITGAGTCALEAHQPGDANYLAARIVDLRFSIARADQTIDFPEPGDLSRRRHEVRLRARASSGLPVAFGVSGPCEIDGSSLRILDSGECSVTARQGGDGNFNAAPPVTRTLRVVLPTPSPRPPA